jgi:hypothetical protein
MLNIKLKLIDNASKSIYSCCLFCKNVTHLDYTDDIHTGHFDQHIEKFQ